MPGLPTVNSDNGIWGTELNNFLTVEHNPTTGAAVMRTDGTVPNPATSVQTTNYTALPGDVVQCDTSSAAFTVKAPNAPKNAVSFTVKLVNGTNTLTVATQGSDVFDKPGGPTTKNLTIVNQSTLFIYIASQGVWLPAGSHLPTSSLLLPTNNLSDLASIATANINLGLMVNPIAYGAKGNGIHTTDGACTASSTTFTSSSASFTTAVNVGQKICVAGAGVSGAVLVTSISAVIDSTHVTMANAASTTVSSATTDYGNDDTVALQNAMNATALFGRGHTVFFGPSPGAFMVSNVNGSVGLSRPGGVNLVSYGGMESYGNVTTIRAFQGSNLDAVVADSNWAGNVGSPPGSQVTKGIVFVGEGSAQASGLGHVFVQMCFEGLIMLCTFTGPGPNGDSCRMDVNCAPPNIPFTATNASPCVFTGSGNGFTGYALNTTVTLSGSPPTGFSTGTTYYVVNPSGLTFELAPTSSGTPINSTSTGTGTVQAVPNNMNGAGVSNNKVILNLFEGTTNGTCFRSTDTTSTGAVFTDVHFMWNLCSGVGGAYAVWVGQAADWVIEGCHVYGLQQNGFRIDHPWNCRINSCYVENYGNTATVGTYYAMDVGGSSFAASPMTVISNCTFSGSAPTASGSQLVHIWSRSSSGTSNNYMIITNCKFGGNTSSPSGLLYAIQLANNATTSNTYLTASGNWFGPGFNGGLGPAVHLPNANGGIYVKGDVLNDGAQFAALSATFTSTSTSITCTNNYAAGQAVAWLTNTGAFGSGPYYVLSAGLSGTAFELATSPGGSAITPSASGNGTLTAVTAIGSGGTVVVTNGAINANTRIIVTTAAIGLTGVTATVAPFVSAISAASGNTAGSFTVTGTAGSLIHWSASEP